MLFNLTSAIARRVFLTNVASRSGLTRSIASSPAFDAPAKATASSTKTKSNTGTKSKEKATEKKSERKIRPENTKVPTRPGLSAFTMFVQAHLKDKTNAVSGQLPHERVKEVAQQWHTVSDEEKKSWADKAKQENEKLAAEFEKWKESVDPSVLRAINRKRRAAGKRLIRVAPKGPKKPLTGFFRFLMEWRNKQEHISNPQEAVKDCARLWAEMSPEQKKVYSDAGKEEFKVYREEQAKWLAQQAEASA